MILRVWGESCKIGVYVSHVAVVLIGVFSLAFKLLIVFHWRLFRGDKEINKRDEKSCKPPCVHRRNAPD